MRVIKSERPIEIPEQWKKLLEIESLPEDTQRANTENVMFNDSRPFRDDKREVAVKVENFTVYGILCSGDRNYWLEWELWNEGNLISNTEGDPDFDISEEVRIQSDDKEVKIIVPVKLG